MENSVYGIMKTRLYYGSTLLKIRIGPQILVKVSHVDINDRLSVQQFTGYEEGSIYGSMQTSL
jgi:hypothetical protein